MEMLREANNLEQNGHEIIHLEIGEPSAGAPLAVIDQAKKILMEKKPIPYTDALGLFRLREKISIFYSSSFNVKIDPKNIIITSGTSGGFVLSLLSAFDSGDKIALSIPGYPAYKNILLSLGLVPVEIKTKKIDKYQPTLMQIKELGNIDGIILSSPSNPTGSMFEDSVLLEIVKYCDNKGIRVLSDEIYHGITYEKNALSIAGKSQNGIILNGFSKKVRIFNYCISNENDKILEFYSVLEGAAGSLHEDYSSTAKDLNNSYDVKTKTIDKICADENVIPDFVKIDVEGHEFQVLEGSKRTALNGKTKFLVEIHSSKLLPIEENLDRVINWAKSISYKVLYLAKMKFINDSESIKNRGRCHLLLVPENFSLTNRLKSIKEGETGFNFL